MNRRKPREMAGGGGEAEARGHVQKASQERKSLAHVGS